MSSLSEVLSWPQLTLNLPKKVYRSAYKYVIYVRKTATSTNDKFQMKNVQCSLLTSSILVDNVSSLAHNH